jgi:hypothetical protein
LVSVVRSRSSSPRLSLFGTFGDEGEWEVASGQSINVVCRRRILKSIRERTERTLTPDAQPKSDADADQREAEKKKVEINQSTKKDISKEEKLRANRSRNLLTRLQVRRHRSLAPMLAVQLANVANSFAARLHSASPA